MEDKIWEAVITRKYQINRLDMNFEDYTDWQSDGAIGRINPLVLVDVILTVSGEPIQTVFEENIERITL